VIKSVKVYLYEGLTEITDGTVLTCVEAGPWPAEFPGVGFKCPAEKDYGAKWSRFTLKRTPVATLSVEDML